MDADRLLRMAMNPNNIVGIFNYCDRWCERCPFTDRCLVYQTDLEFPSCMGEEEEQERALQFVATRFALTRELLQWKMAKLNVPEPSDAQLASVDAEAEARERRVAQHSLLQAARAYARLVADWFESEGTGLRRRVDRLVEELDSGADVDALLVEITQVKNALDIIQYDRRLIERKLYRGLDGREWSANHPDPYEDPVQNDANGSVKVALVSIDRSEIAWRVIAAWMNADATAGLVADLLAQLRMQVAREFPDARRFRRPGFDDLLPR